MGKLGYTWYPKDWGNSESVFELNLIERGLYRELIDMAMLNDNKVIINTNIWARKFNSIESEILDILNTLLSLKLIEIKADILFIPSCESRLNLVRGGSKGGKKSKPNSKPTSKPSESLDKKNEKPIANQIEIENKIKEINTIYDKFKDEVLKGYWSQQIEILYMNFKLQKGTLQELLDEWHRTVVRFELRVHNSTQDFLNNFRSWLKIQEDNKRLDKYKI